MADVILEVKRLFDSIYLRVNKVAGSRVDLYIVGLDLQALDTEQQIQKICKELDLSNQEMDGFVRKDYLEVVDCESRHYNTFFSHYLFDRSNEESQLLQGLFLTLKNNRLNQLLREAIYRLSPFTPADFIKGRWNVVFYLLEQRPPHTSKKDYFAMRSWQIAQKVDCVNLLLDQLIERFNDEVAKGGNKIELARSELQLLNELCNANQYTTREFITRMGRLKGVGPGSLPEDETEFHQSYGQFVHGKTFSHTLTPPLLRSALEQVRSGQLPPVPLCGWSLIKYKKWLTGLLEGKKGLDGPYYQSCGQLLELPFEQGVDKGKRYMAELKEKYPKGSLSEKKYKMVLFKEINKFNVLFNFLEYPEFYQFLPNRETAKIYFLNHCMLEIDMEKQLGELRKSIFINEVVKRLKHELYGIDESLIKPFQNLKDLKNRFADLISFMVPNPPLMGQLWSLFQRTLRALAARKPILFIMEDLNEAFLKIFNQAQTNLEQLLEHQPGNMKAVYAIKQIMDLELRALKSEANDLNLNEYFDKVKKIFKIQLECVQSMQQFDSLKIKSCPMEPIVQDILVDEPPMQVNHKITFGCKKSPGFLTPFIHHLNEKLGFLDDRTSVDDFFRIVTSENLKLISDKIYLGCKTNEFKYIIKCLKPFFKSFNFATIGKSGIFISNAGITITTTNLNSADIESLKTKYAIDNIFNKKPQKH